MMIHHFLYFAVNRTDQAPGSCWGNAGFIGGRGEEHPSGDFTRRSSPQFRNTYGINNRTPQGDAPTWNLTAMVMNHYKRPKDFYVRTKVWYTTEPRKSVMPLVVGNCATLGNGMAYDVPGGGPKGSEYVDETDWTVPEGLNGRIIYAASHNHGGGKYQTLASKTCDRGYFKAPVYHGTRDHIYNRIRPILHEPGPIANGTYASYEGVPISEGEVLTRRAVHDNHNLHVASMGFWALMVVRDDSVKRCAPMPGDVTEVMRPRRFDRTPPHDAVVPQLVKPGGPMTRFTGGELPVGDNFFRPQRLVAKPGEQVTWRFAGREPHSVTVANGPRGFSSRYLGQAEGTYSYTPKVKGTYRLTCLIHPTQMGQTLVVR
jgi:plastocyanin